ncbi:protein phosphatase [Tsukamurella strandjordii]|uniref:Protein phosphatase n=1 Tax=Tsukamurella strandjordii TaxID=147577 RepID=A0AA90NEN0_9ACTN|nr:protein phosphatase [Tsukamurella strandjordii]MDP0397076.1 protein phosphatase [Tsukamurella strandjordii]
MVSSAVTPWAEGTAGLLRLPSGLLVRGRGLRAGAPDESATVTLALTWLPPESAPGRILWVRTPDFGVPLAPEAARRRFAQAHALLPTERVEVVCGGGIGRTGTGLAALAILDGLTPTDAVDYVRTEYHPRAVETPWQRWFLAGVRR